MTEPVIQGPQVVLDVSAVRAYADADIRVHELVDMLEEDGFPVLVLPDTFDLAETLESAPEAKQRLAELRDRVPVVLVESDTVRRAIAVVNVFGVAYGQAVAEMYAVDHFFYIATWTPTAVAATLGRDLAPLIINLLSPDL